MQPHSMTCGPGVAGAAAGVRVRGGAGGRPPMQPQQQQKQAWVAYAEGKEPTSCGVSGLNVCQETAAAGQDS